MSLFVNDPDFTAIQDEWRTQPTDLGGWANRAAQMKLLAEHQAAEIKQLSEALKVALAALERRRDEAVRG